MASTGTQPTKLTRADGVTQTYHLGQVAAPTDRDTTAHPSTKPLVSADVLSKRVQDARRDWDEYVTTFPVTVCADCERNESDVELVDRGDEYQELILCDDCADGRSEAEHVRETQDSLRAWLHTG